MDWISSNYTWFFSGLGSTIISFVIGFVIGNNKCKKNINIKNSDQNTIIQK